MHHTENPKIKAAIDLFVDQCSHDKDNGHPNVSKVKKTIDEVRINLSDAGQITTLRWVISYIDQLKEWEHRINLRDIRIYCQGKLDMKLEQAADIKGQDVSGDIENFIESRERERIKYTDNYWDTAIQLERGDRTQKQVWKEMKAGRNRIGLEPKYDKYHSFRKQLNREKLKRSIT